MRYSKNATRTALQCNGLVLPHGCFRPFFSVYPDDITQVRIDAEEGCVAQNIYFWLIIIFRIQHPNFRSYWCFVSRFHVLFQDS